MIKIQGVIPLVIGMGELQVEVGLGIGQNLAVHVLLRTKNDDKVICGVFSMESDIVREHSEPVAILRRCTETNISTLLSREGPMDEQKITRKDFSGELYHYSG